MVEVKKATFAESMMYIKPLLRMVSSMNLPHTINKDRWILHIEIPKWIPVKPEDK